MFNRIKIGIDYLSNFEENNRMLNEFKEIERSKKELEILLENSFYNYHKDLSGDVTELDYQIILSKDGFALATEQSDVSLKITKGKLSKIEFDKIDYQFLLYRTQLYLTYIIEALYDNGIIDKEIKLKKNKKLPYLQTEKLIVYNLYNYSKDDDNKHHLKKIANCIYNNAFRYTNHIKHPHDNPQSITNPTKSFALKGKKNPLYFLTQKAIKKMFNNLGVALTQIDYVFKNTPIDN
jgi:hypothetical protein